MYQVFLVDDEFLAIEGLRLLVDWERLGAEVCGVAYDGISAREQILEKKPDIVLTDIRMPGMNGLDLIAAVKQALPSTVFVVISGYNEFEYARSALRLGVIDYIDKPVTVEKIEDVYRKIEQVFEARAKFNQESREQQTRLSEAMEELIHFPVQTQETLEKLKEKYQVDLAGLQSFAAAVFKPAQPDGKELVGQRFAQEFVESGVYHCASYLDESLVLLLSFPIAFDHAAFEAHFHIFCEGLVLDGIVEAAGLGNVCSGIAELAYGLKDGQQALEYAEYADEPFVAARELSYTLTPPAQLLNGTNSIVYSFHIGEYRKVLEKVDEMLNLLLESGLALDLFYSECLKLVHIGIGLCRETGREFDRDGKPFLPHVEIRQYNKAADIADWVFSVFEGMVAWLNEQKQSEEKSVLPAKEYIDRHYSEPITLPFLASLCRMQPTYFSMLFKEQVGQTYIKYINFVRMEHAKLMLSQGMKVKEIYEQVGFQNYRYFCDKFKVLLGCTPEQYRSRFL